MTPLPPWFGFVAASLAASRGAFDLVARLVETPVMQDAASADHPRIWTTRHVLRRNLGTMRVLDFSTRQPGASAIVVAPFALHSAATADFARSHSVVEALIKGGVTRLLLTDWHSAAPEDRYLSIDSYLADLNVLVDDAGAPAALVGLCQGGWLATAYAARFPEKVSRLALVGAPIDIQAGGSAIADITGMTQKDTIRELVSLGDGLLMGRLMMAMWPTANPTPEDITMTLQLEAGTPPRTAAVLAARFGRWHSDVIDLPGVFYEQATEWIFRENRLANGQFVALGERISLKSIGCPAFLLAADKDEVTTPAQLMAMTRRISTPRSRITARTVPGRHLSLFMGKRVIAEDWPDIARFLAS